MTKVVELFNYSLFTSVESKLRSNSVAITPFLTWLSINITKLNSYEIILTRTLFHKSQTAQSLKFSVSQTVTKLSRYFKGATINTPSMIAVADYIDALNRVESIGGLDAMIAGASANAAEIEKFVSSERDWGLLL